MKHKRLASITGTEQNADKVLESWLLSWGIYIGEKCVHCSVQCVPSEENGGVVSVFGDLKNLCLTPFISGNKRGGITKSVTQWNIIHSVHHTWCETRYPKVFVKKNLNSMLYLSFTNNTNYGSIMIISIQQEPLKLYNRNKWKAKVVKFNLQENKERWNIVSQRRLEEAW